LPSCGDRQHQAATLEVEVLDVLPGHPPPLLWDELQTLSMARGDVAMRSGLSRRSMERYRYKGGVRPRRKHELILTLIAVEWTRTELTEHGVDMRRNDEAILHRFADFRSDRLVLPRGESTS
jgi:hypothetical protein